jgi:hypothetical protein
MFLTCMQHARHFDVSNDQQRNPHDIDTPQITSVDI